jgi:hypothetical protein
MLLSSTRYNVRSLLRRSNARLEGRFGAKVLKYYFSSNADSFSKPGFLQFNIPKRLRQKVVGIEDAVSLVSSGDTVTCSGFVAQGKVPLR